MSSTNSKRFDSSERPRARIALFASGNGSNLQAFIDMESRDPDWPLQIAVVVSDKPGCFAVTRAKNAEIPVFAVSPKEFPDKDAYERVVLARLQELEVRWIILAGYMRLVGSVLLSAYPNRILNIHPSLLPAFPGRTAVKDALTAGASESGVTIHYVDAGIDTGPIIAQERVAIQPGDTESELFARIHQVEHALYPAVVRQVICESQRA